MTPPSMLPTCASMIGGISLSSREGILSASVLAKTLPTLMDSTYEELHRFYADVVNYPMRQRLVDSRGSGRIDEMYNLLPEEARGDLRMVPDAMNNIVTRLTVDENYVNAPTIYVSETDPKLAERANWVQLLVGNRLVLTGGVVRDLPQLVGLRDYDRAAFTALITIGSVYVCGVYKRAEARLSVCDRVLTLAADQLHGLFPPGFDAFLRECCESHMHEKGGSDAPFTFDSCLTWSTEVMGFRFRDAYLRLLFESDQEDAVMARLRSMESAARDAMRCAPSVSRGFVWTQLWVINVRIAVEALFRYGPRSERFRPSSDDGVYTDADMARMFFDVADGCGMHCPYDALRHYNTPYSPKDGDSLPLCPICLEATHYCGVGFVASNHPVVNCKRCLQPVHSRCMRSGNLTVCPCCRESEEWSMNVEDVRRKLAIRENRTGASLGSRPTRGDDEPPRNL